jgi:hypothetical protein
MRRRLFNDSLLPSPKTQGTHANSQTQTWKLTLLDRFLLTQVRSRFKAECSAAAALEKEIRAAALAGKSGGHQHGRKHARLALSTLLGPQ